jgi:hypothetical protein
MVLQAVVLKVIKKRKNQPHGNFGKKKRNRAGNFRRNRQGAFDTICNMTGSEFSRMFRMSRAAVMQMYKRLNQGYGKMKSTLLTALMVQFHL